MRPENNTVDLFEHHPQVNDNRGPHRKHGFVRSSRLRQQMSC